MTDPPREHVARGQSTMCFEIGVNEDKEEKVTSIAAVYK